MQLEFKLSQMKHILQGKNYIKIQKYLKNMNKANNFTSSFDSKNNSKQSIFIRSICGKHGNVSNETNY